jgi:hypothetical protein
MMSLEKWLKLLLIIVFFIIIIQIVRLYKKNDTPKPNPAPSQSQTQCNDNKCIKNENKNGTCGEGCKSCDSLLPVLDPRFNMREICKQSVLLEDHLFQKEKRCHDCIIKHFLTIEGLSEEAITLDKEQKYPELIDLPQKIRVIEQKYLKNHTDPKQPAITAQELREIRKGYMQKCFDAFMK